MDGIVISLKKLLPEPTPSEKARREIEHLATDERFMGNPTIGGPTPPEELARIAELEEARRREKFNIIAKHSVFGEHLAHLYRVEARLMKRLDTVRRDIADLIELRNKDAQSGQ